MLEKCGSLAVLVSLRTILPVAASATNRSIEKRLRSERNAIQRPSGLIAGPTLRSSPRPIAADHLAADLVWRHRLPRAPADRRVRIAACQSSDSSLALSPSTCSIATSVSPAAAAVDSICADDAVAPAAADIRPERLAPAVREVLAVVELLDRRQAVDAAFPGFRVGLVERPRGVAQPHRRIRIDRADRESIRPSPR